MESCERLEWFVIRMQCGQDSRALSALSSAGIQHFDPEFCGRHSLLPGRNSMCGKVFPGHIFVAVEPGHAILERPTEMPGISALFREDDGRPITVPRGCIADLKAYCKASRADDVPPALRALDLLYGGERLSHFLNYCWGHPHRASLDRS